MAKVCKARTKKGNKCTQKIFRKGLCKQHFKRNKGQQKHYDNTPKMSSDIMFKQGTFYTGPQVPPPVSSTDRLSRLQDFQSISSFLDQDHNERLHRRSKRATACVRPSSVVVKTNKRRVYHRQLEDDTVSKKQKTSFTPAELSFNGDWNARARFMARERGELQ